MIGGIDRVYRPIIVYSYIHVVQGRRPYVRIVNNIRHTEL